MTTTSPQRILFAEPPPLDRYRIPERFAGCTYMLYPLPDLAQLYLMSYLEGRGHEVDLINAVLERFSRDEFLRRVADWHPDVVVLHSVILAKPTDLAVLPLLLECAPKARIFFHGPEPTRVPEEYLRAIPPQISEGRVLVFRGEPERHVADYLATGEPIGASYVRNGEICETPHSEQFVDLDNLPFTHHRHPAVQRHKRALFNPKFSVRPVATILASRGCRWRCAFCVPNSVSFARELEYVRCHPGEKPPAVFASPARVIAEFREIAEAGYRAVMVMDDQFLGGRSRTKEICDGLRSLDLQWGCLSRSDYLVDEEIVRLLSAAGCVTIDIGVETFSQPILDAIHKDLKVETIYRSISLLRRYGIEPKINIMFGTCPLEQEENICHTVDTLLDLDVHHVMFTVATPFKGTPFYEQACREGFLVDEDDAINPFRKSIVSYPHLSRERLNRLVDQAYRRFYLRPSQVWWRLRHARSLRSLLSDA
ncbi:MAG TPA: radical SAM protein, partial [bacterium]|nr:radical SAM protein [bacterium]